MVKHVVEVAVRKFYHVIVDDPDETMTNAEAAMIAFNTAKANPDVLLPIDGQSVDDTDIEYAMHSGMYF